MKSEKKDAASFVLKESENAVVLHCTIHNLNLSVSSAANIQLVGRNKSNESEDHLFYKSK